MSATRTINLTDPKALRAVAHPTRLKLIGLLRRSGPLTATEAAAKVGESPSSCSFHLRQLAKYGLVEEAGGGQGRARPWRATAMFTEWPDAGAGAESDAAATMLSRVVIERYLENAAEWLERSSSEPPEWVEAASFGDSVLFLTAAELAELNRLLMALLEPYMERLEDPSSRPEGARAVVFARFLFPIVEGDEAA